MVQGLIPVILEAFDGAVDFAGKVIVSFDEEKFSKAVSDFWGKEPSVNEWDEAVELVKEADDIDTCQKVELLKAIAKERDAARSRELEQKKDIVNKLDEHNEKKAQVAVKIVAGVLSAGVTLIPEAVKRVKDVIDEKEVIEVSPVEGNISAADDEKPVEETDNEDTPQ